MTSDSWRHHIFGAAKSPSKIRLKLTPRDGPIVIPPEGGTLPGITHRTSARPRSGALTQRCRPGLGSFIHNQKRLGERVNEILGDVHSRDTRLDQRQGRRDEPVKLWSDCRIRSRNQPIKPCLSERPAEIVVVGQCRQTTHRQCNHHQRPLPKCETDFMRLSRPNCRPKCKTINPVAAAILMKGLSASKQRGRHSISFGAGL